ncbi:MAG: polar amino acid transporter inner rane subunit [Rhodospirillales bacterium]|jgi:polar amino acid transport system permease protein|nr:polar amino acid transporter inner rane subunit [Rhodospirillales bacterium]
MSYQLQFGSVLANLDELLDGAATTLWMGAATILLGSVLGIVLAILRTSGPALCRRLIDGYVEIVRNTPFLVQLFFIFFGLPSIGIRLLPIEAALLALVFNLGGYATEIVRAGIESIHPGQIEAGLSLGLSRWRIYRHVVIVPALERVYPALSSQSVLALLGTSVVSQISVVELTAVGNTIQSATYRAFEVYIVITVLYLGLAFASRGAFWLIGLAAFSRRRRLGARA